MWGVIVNRFKQGYRTLSYPKGKISLPKRFRGRPIVSGAAVDMGKLLFNKDAQAGSPEGSLVYSRDHRMAVSKKQDLVVHADEIKLASALNDKMKKIFGRSLKLREVNAGSCGGCDAEIQVLGIVVFDLSRFGIQFVASPRHADGLIITGPVTKNMEAVLKKTYEATPYPKIVIAVGACAISGGPFTDSPEVKNGADKVVPVDLYIPGCPPHPLTILDGLLRLLGKIEEKEPWKLRSAAVKDGE